MPAPERGERGEKGERGETGPAPSQEQLQAITKAFFDAYSAAWTLDFERRANETLRRAIEAIPLPRDGRDGKDGAPGIDGAALEDFDAELEADGRTLAITVKLSNGGEATKRIQLAIPQYLGTYRSGARHQKGDAVTYARNVWIAMQDTDQRPGPGPDWRLALRAGKDGRDAPGVRDEPGGEGDPE
jgi:hypothetical protein